ncbi:hypothetical protein GGI20_002946 [Coemansia sp. BCRC 34301]|nr:hypothetical protein GGI20_002946 [Coemansia sp. BCRC 34301]
MAVDVCTVLITVAVFASIRHPSQWNKQRYWIQTNIAPVLAIIVFFPLVMTVVVQIIWRFRSVEFVYCWIPRTPVYARWIAIDAWRLLIILAIVVTYTRILILLHKKPPPPPPATNNRLSAIDSAQMSLSTGDEEINKSFFVQSVHNIHRWAWSKLGFSASPIQQPPYTEYSRSCYEPFKRSFVANFVRRFFLAVDIPSPTIPASIFDKIGPPSSANSSHRVDSYACSTDIRNIDNRVSDNGLKRWYSALSRLITAAAARRNNSQQSFHGYPQLRRSHTAPVLTSDAMGLCSCVFKRRSHDHSQNQTPDTTTAILSPPAPCATCNSHLQLPVSRSVSVKRRFTLDEYPLESANINIFASNNLVYSDYYCSDDSDDESSARIVQVEKLVSLEDGHWAQVVDKCRHDRGQRVPRVSRLYVYPLAYLLVWLPSIAYYVVSTHVYYTAFRSARLDSVVGSKRSLDMSRLPAHWTGSQNMHRVWPYYQRLTEGVWGSDQLGWLAIIQSLHMLSGAVDALLFWLTE